MDFLRLIKERKTTYEFNDKQVSNKNIHDMLEAARWAPSCSNTQPWHFIVIKDPKKIDLIMQTANYGAFHSLPTCMIAVILIEKECPGKGFACFRGQDSGTKDTFMSAGIAGLNIVYLAQERGIHSCILTVSQMEVKKILNVSKNDAVPLVIGLGYERKGAYQAPRERKPLSELVSGETMGKKYEMR